MPTTSVTGLRISVGDDVAVRTVSPSELITILEGGEDDDLKGIVETASVDFKSHPYQLDEPKGRNELVKDVVAMSNSGGGVLVMGVRTRKDPATSDDVADRATPFPSHLIDEQQYRQIVRESAYPPIENLGIRAFAREGGNVVVAIEIPRPPHDRLPFLQRKIHDSKQDRIVTAIALPRRDGSHTAYENIGLIHRDIADGRVYRQNRAQAMLAPTRTEVPPEPPSPRELIGPEIEEIERLLEWQEHPAIYLLATPLEVSGRPTDFYARDGLQAALAEPHTIRPNGFGLTYGTNVRREANALLAVDAEMRVLRVRESGVMVAGALGTPDFLGWAQERKAPPMGLAINPIVLIEWTTEFALFVDRELAPRYESQWEFVVAARGLTSRGHPLLMYPGDGRGVIPPAFNGASTDTFEEIVIPDRDPLVLALHLIRRIYEAFGLSEADIPFAPFGKVSRDHIRNFQ